MHGLPPLEGLTPQFPLPPVASAAGQPLAGQPLLPSSADERRSAKSRRSLGRSRMDSVGETELDDLVKSARGGDSAAFNALCANAWGYARSIAARKAPHMADDIAQDVF